jgi:hypothetical protein
VSDPGFRQDASVPPFGLSSWCRLPPDSPADFGRLASDLGAPSIALDATVTTAWLAELLSGRDTRALPIEAIESPCPRPRGDRPARLASPDKDERREAIAQTLATIEVAEKTQARAVVVRLGRLDVKDGWRETVRAFQRGTWKPATAREQLAERAKMSTRSLDFMRFGLEPVLERAGAAGVSIALVNRARWFELPDDAETAVLLEDFRGAPLTAWFDPAAAHAREVLGYSRAQDTLAALGPRCSGAWLSDAAGLLGGLPWGRADADHALLGLPAPTLRIVHCAPGASQDELRSAIAAG